MKSLLSIVILFLYQDLRVFAMPNCGRSFCFGNGRCEHNSVGTWYCRCDESFHGSQCQFKKISYVAELNISQIALSNASYTGGEIIKELSNRHSKVYESAENLTEIFFQQALSVLPNFMRGIFSAQRNSSILFKIEFSEISEINLITLRKLVKIALNKNQNTVTSSKAYANHSIRFDTITVRDFDECTEVSKDVCMSYRSCQNIIGSFSCVCNDGYLDMSGECATVSKEEFDWRQVSIWGGIVFIILLWMIAAIFCTARRRCIKRRQSNVGQREQSQIGKDLNKHRPSENSRASSENSRKISLGSNASVSYMDSPKNLTAHARIRSHSDTSLYSFPSSHTTSSEVDLNSVFGSPAPSRPTRLHYNHMQSSLPDISSAQNASVPRDPYSRHSSSTSSMFIEVPLREGKGKERLESSLTTHYTSFDEKVLDSSMIDNQSSIGVVDVSAKQPNIIVTTPSATKSQEPNSSSLYQYPVPDY